MAQDSYPFIDIAVIDPLRARFLAGDAIVVLDVKLERIIWANGAGARLFGYGDIEAARDSVADLGITTRRQIAATPGFPRIGPGRSLLVRMTQGLSSHAIGIVASEIALPDGKSAIMLAAPDIEAAKRPAAELAQRAIYGIGEAGHHAALVDGNGEVIAQSTKFQTLGLEQETLHQLARDVAVEADRLAKRLVRAKGHSWPAGIALLSEEPVRALLVVVDDPLDEEAASPSSFGRRETLNIGRGKADMADDNWEFVDRRSKQVAPPVAVSAEAAPAFSVVLQPQCEEPAVEAFEQDEDGEVSPEAPAASLPVRIPTMVAANTTLLPGSDVPQEPANDSAPLGPDVATDRGQAEESDDEAEASFDADTAEPGNSPDDPFAPDLRSGPVRFVWKTDALGRFSDLSHEFAKAVGEKVANVIGQSFRDVAARFGLDPDGEIAGLLERRDTWSGRSVMWPIQDTDLKAPVDLAALPVYGRDRQFEGFRGFGVVRLADAVVDEDAAGLDIDKADVGTAHQESIDSVDAEPPVLAPIATDARDGSDKVIRLAEHRTSPAERALSATESNAFREIGERLREANSDLPPTADANPEQGGEDFEAQSEYVNVTPETIDAPWDDETDSFDELDGSETDDADALFADDIDFAPSTSAPNAPRTSDADLFDVTDRNIDDENQIDQRTASANDTSILAKLPIPLIIHSGDELHFANEEFFALTGYESLDEFADAGGLDALFAEPDGDETIEPGDHRRLLITRDGSRFRVEALLQSVPWGHGKALMLAIKPAPEAIAPTEASNSDTLTEEIDARVAELQTILDTATDGIVIITNEGDIRSLSRPAEALFGFDSFELVGKPFVSLFAVESQRSARDYLSGLSDNGVASVLNDGREVIGRESRGRYIPLFMTIGRLPAGNGYCAVLRDITQWKRAEEELTQARAEAERSSGQKTEFLARISHEIRTPLNAIIGFSELMIDEKFGPVLNDRYRDYLRDINRSGNHVLDLVNDLLDISKIEAGEQEMAHEAVSLNETLAEAVAMMQPQANRERVIIRSSFASRLPEVVADQRSIRQIALNLLSNAVRYTQAGGQVIVSTSYETSGDVVMRFRDTGVGMSQAEIEQAMKPFKQINALKRPRGDGTGLGLPLTKAMVEANRARFVINSAPSEGTLIEITFPSTRVLAG